MNLKCVRAAPELAWALGLASSPWHLQGCFVLLRAEGDPPFPSPTTPASPPASEDCLD
jgi:hypothetical protein